MTEGTMYGLRSQLERLTAQRAGIKTQIKATESAIARTLKPKVEPLEMRMMTKCWAEKVPAGEKVWSWFSVQGTDTHSLKKRLATLGSLNKSLASRIRKIRQRVVFATAS